MNEMSAIDRLNDNEPAAPLQVTPRLQRLMAKVNPKSYPICIEKARLVIESYRAHAGLPHITRKALAIAHFLDNRTIFIEDDELIVGNIASKPCGLEVGPHGPTWPEEDFTSLLQSGYEISPEDEAELRALDSYWLGKGRTFYERMGRVYDDERIWPFIQSGIMLPPWAKKDEGRGHGITDFGWGLTLGYSLIVVDFEKVLRHGTKAIIAAAEEELRNLRFLQPGGLEKAEFLQAVIIAHQALIRIANRFAKLALDMAGREQDPARRAELEEIAAICAHVPEHPARTFREALQSFWFTWLMIASGTAAGGRFDQFMYPYYKADLEAGRINPAQAAELLAMLRLKVMHSNGVAGGKTQRDKWSGMAKWHNWIIGGVTRDGKDATNDLSYLILDAAKLCPTPHHTITLRVHDGTPQDLMIKALEVVKLGIGLPAFVNDQSYIDYFTGEGASVEDARDYAIGGCLDGQLPGKSRTNAMGMFVVPLVFLMTMNNGFDSRTQKQLGPKTGAFEDFATFEDFFAAFKTQLRHFMELAAEEHNILLQAQADFFADPIHSSLMEGAIEVGRDALARAMPFENGAILNPVGMINVADSMAAVKKLVFEEKKVSKSALRQALAANWDGFEDMQKLFYDAPKYGNGDAFVDGIANTLYTFWSDTARTFTSIYGGAMKVAGISITSYGPAGSLTGATPDGRFAGENLADGSMSAEQGRDLKGPTALIRSAMTIDQRGFQATLFNMKFHPTAMTSKDDLGKVAALIRTYFRHGGKHVQFNVVNRDMLLDAQKNPERHRNLIVRVAGYSAYFVQLNAKIQADIIGRTEQHFAGA